MSRQFFIALRHRDFRLLWTGLLVSNTGSQMQQAAILWHVSLLVPPGQKGLALGFVGLVRVVPIIVFSLTSGVVADVWNRRRLMLFTQISATVVAAALAALTFHGLSVVWPLYLFTAIHASVIAFDMPARQSLIPNLVSREHLPNAISLQSIMFQTAAVLGPSLGGIIIATAGVAWVYVFNAVSFVFVIGALLMMRGVPEHGDVEARKTNEVSIHAAAEGLRFVFRAPIIRSTMLLDFVATFFSSATALLPIFAQDILKVGARGYGWLYAADAGGAFVASVAMVSMTDRIERRGLVLIYSVIGFGLATVVFGLSRSFWLTFFALAATGAFDTVSTVIRGIIRQLETPDRLRGRMTGVNMIFVQGGPQLGELEAGLVANWFGAPFSVITGGVGCLIATGLVASTTSALRRYRRDDARDRSI